MNHTGQPETILPDWRDGRIRELELENEQLQRHIGSLVTQIHGERQRPEGNATVAVPRRFLSEFMAALNFRSGHGEPSFDRVQAVMLHEEARALLSPQKTP